MTKKIKIKNLDCANCGRKLEEKINKIDGVNSCKVSFMMQTITLDYNDDNTYNEFLKVCKKVEPDMEVLG